MKGQPASQQSNKNMTDRPTQHHGPEALRDGTELRLHHEETDRPRQADLDSDRTSSSFWIVLRTSRRRTEWLGRNDLDRASTSQSRQQPISFRLVAARVSLRMTPDACAAAPRAPHGWLHHTHVDQHASFACAETPRAWSIHLVLLHVRLHVQLPCMVTPQASGDTQLVRLLTPRSEPMQRATSSFSVHWPDFGAVPERLGVELLKVFGFIAASYSEDCLRALQTSARSLGHQTPLSIVLGCTCGRSERIHSLIGDKSPGEWEIILDSIQTRGLDQVVYSSDFSLHFLRLSGSMNCVEECMGLRAGGTFSMFVLVLGDNLVDSWYRSRILRHDPGHVFLESEDLEIHPSETHGSWVRFFINRRLYGLSSRNLKTGWTFILELEGWMDYRPRIRRVDGLSLWNPEAGWTLVLEPVGCRASLNRVRHSLCPRRSCRNLEVYLSIMRSYLDPEVMWEPGGSPFDPQIVSGPGGHVGTQRPFGNPEVPSGRGGRLGTRRFLLDPEVVSNPEVALDPEVVWEPGSSSRPGGTVLRLPRQDYSRKSLTGLEGAGVGVMTQVPGFAAFHVWRTRSVRLHRVLCVCTYASCVVAGIDMFRTMLPALLSRSTIFDRILWLVELVRLEPKGFGVDPSETWRFSDVGEHLCKVIAGIDLGLEPESASLLSASSWVSHSQRFTMSFNVQAALCFPLGEPLSAFSRRHSMTRRLFLNLPCHGHADGKVYQGTWPGKTVVRWSEPWIWNLEAGIRNLEAGTRDPEVWLFLLDELRRSSSVPGAWAGFLSWNNPVKFDKYSKALYPPCDQVYLGFHYHFDART
ncbi:hypothetical protein YC2023_011069 [Brassica napus]